MIYNISTDYFLEVHLGKVQKKIYTRGRNFQLCITRNRCRSVDCGNGCAYRYGDNPHKCVGCCQLMHLRCIAHHTLHNVNSVSFFHKRKGKSIFPNNGSQHNFSADCRNIHADYSLLPQRCDRLDSVRNCVDIGNFRNSYELNQP